MELGMLPVDRIDSRAAGDFAAGTLIFSPYVWGGVEPLQVGVRVGNGVDVFALTDWHGGHSKAGTIVRTDDNHPVFGFQTNELPRIYIDPSAVTVEGDASRGARGLVGLGREGLLLVSQRSEDRMPSIFRSYMIDPQRWEPVTPTARAFPNVYVQSWQLRLGLPGGNAFVATIAR